MAKKKPAVEVVENPVAQPYYLQKAHVKDYRSVRDAEVEFKPGLNIIIGPNGAGKTNFLRAVVEGIDSLATNKAAPGSRFVLSSTHTHKIAISYLPPEDTLPNGFRIERTRVQVQVGQESPTEAADVFLAWISEAAIGSKLISYPAYWVSFIRHHLPGKQLPLLEQDARPRLTARFERTSATTGFTLALIESLRLEAVRREQEQSAPVTEVQAAELIAVTVSDYLAHLNPYLARYSPVTEARVSLFLRPSYDPVQHETTVTGLFLEYCVNGAWRQFQELSDGTKRLIYLISDLVTPEAGNVIARESQKPVARIILLEEPELGIHPHQLHLLLNLIREVSTKHQVILTTHSPQVLDMLKADELDRILICTLDEPKKGTQFRRLTDAQQEKARRYMTKIGFLSDYWRYSRLEEDAAAANEEEAEG